MGSGFLFHGISSAELTQVRAFNPTPVEILPDGIILN
jgi:hypothetical protein